MYNLPEKRMDLKMRARQLITDIPEVFLCLQSKNTPLIAKILAGITVGYAFSPIDLIPDFIPVIGYLDDIIILPMLIALTIRFIPKDDLALFREKAKIKQLNVTQKKWYYGIPVAIIWLTIIYLITKMIFPHW